ncbi:hypothetical protein D3C86_1213880 [compost metagenome]
MAKAPTPQQHQTDHHAGAPHRHLEAGQNSVAKGPGKSQHAGARQPRPGARPPAQTRQPGNQAIQQPGQQADMLTGNHQQVHRAGVLQHAPIRHRQTRAITQHQRRQGSLATLGIDCEQALTQAIAPAARPAGGAQQLAALDRAGSANALRQQPGLVIERLWVDQAVWPLEAHRQTPGLAGPQRGAAIPGQTQPRRQLGAPRLGLLQVKPNHSIAHVRQADHPPLQPQRSAIELRRQPVIQRRLRRDAGPTEAKQEKRQRIAAKWQQHQAQYRQQP